MEGLMPFHDVVMGSVWKTSKETPHRIAFRSVENHWPDVSFSDFYTSVLSVARFLSENGVKKGDIGLISMPNSWHFFPFFFGMSCVGGATSACSPDFTPYEMEYQLDDTQAVALLTTGANVEKILKIIDKLPNLKIIVHVGPVPPNTPRKDVKLVSFEDVVSEEPIFDRKSVKINILTDLVSLPYSSGTTGMPKGVMITHLNFLSQMLVFFDHFMTQVLPFDDPVEETEEDLNALQFLPFYHAYGFTSLCGQIMRGRTILIMEHFKSDLLLQTVQKYKLKHLTVIPMLFNFLTHSDAVNRYDLSSVHSASSGGAPLSPHMIEQVQKKLPNLKHIFQGYGMTEMVSATHMSVLDVPTPPGAVGRLVRQCQHKVVDPETGKTLAGGQVGEICIKGATMMKGYWRNPKATEEAIDSEGFYRTGDIGCVDAAGFLFLKDRIKELIKVRAYQVAPAELEHVLLTNGGIQDCAVIGVPDEKDGEAPVAFVVRKNEKLGEEDVKNYVKERVSSYKQIKKVQFVDHILRTATGKILRRKIKEEYLRSNKSKL